MKRSSRQLEELIALKQKNDVDKIIIFFMNSFRSKSGIYVKLMRSLKEMEELTKFQSSTIDTFLRRRSALEQDTFLEFTGKIQELQMQLIVWTIPKNFRKLNHYAVDIPTLPVGGMHRLSLRMRSRKDEPPSIWDTHGISGNVIADLVALSTALYPQELNPWNSCEEPLHSSTVEQS